MFGIRAALCLLLALSPARHGAKLRRRVRRLEIPGFQHPFYFRERSSDPDVIHQVFVQREYACVSQERDISSILDCGANIGCAAFLFLHCYPNARLIAVEPEPENMALCRRNLEPFRERVTFVEAAVWPVAVPLELIRGKYGDGRDWAVQVREASGGNPANLMATTIDDLLNASGHPTIDLLKMDIEAAELHVLRPGCETWLQRTRNLVIELHDDECERQFQRALAGARYHLTRSGELTACRGMRPKLSA